MSGARWLLLDAGPMDAPTAFGRMPIVAGRVVNEARPALMTSVWAKGHFQVGWFDDVDAVIDLDAARAAQVDVFRRPIWGGGTAFYDTNAAALWSWFSPPDAFASLDEALEHFRPAMEHALKALGLGGARFEGSSDIRFEGRKLGTLITQSVLGTVVVGGFLNLRRPDLDLYKRVARVPEEKFKDKVIKDAVAYICTPADVRGRDVSYEELRDAIVAASREILGIDFEEAGFTAEDDAAVKGFVDTVSADDWVKRVSSERFREEAPEGARVGFANLKAKKLVRAGVALGEDGTILRAMIAGDMHVSPPDAMDRVARAIEGCAVPLQAENVVEQDELIERIAAVLGQPDVEQPDEAAGITAEDVAEAVALAVKDACRG